MKKIIIISIMSIILLFPITVSANIMCNDGTTSPTCGDCHRGCCSHHGGCASNSGSSNSYSNNSKSSNNYSNSSTITQKVVAKSSDTSLKEIKVDDKSIEISDNMNIDVSKKTINIEATANDYKAKVEYDREIELVNGTNNCIVKVTAEDGTVKEYTLTINNKLLSNNKRFKLYYDGKRLKVNSKTKTIETITVDSSVKNLKLKAILSDENAKIKFKGVKNLTFGENKVKVIVIAENKSKKTYTMIVNKKLF